MPESALSEQAEHFISELGGKYDYDLIKGERLQLLLDSASAVSPKRILEIGTAAGSSALRLAAATGAIVDTIDIDSSRLDMARKLWSLDERGALINAYCADASDMLKELASKYKYDFVFMDAAKSKYGEYLDIIYDAINTGGIIFADDVLYLGLVDSDCYPPHKHRTIVYRLREFLAKVRDKSVFDTRIYDIDNGVAICKKL